MKRLSLEPAKTADDISIEFSYGIMTYDAFGGQEIEELINAADTRMYEQKKQKKLKKKDYIPVECRRSLA